MSRTTFDWQIKNADQQLGWFNFQKFMTYFKEIENGLKLNNVL